MDPIAWITIATFAVGVIFFAGKLSARVDKLEEWKAEVRVMHSENRNDLTAIREEMRRLGERYDH